MSRAARLMGTSVAFSVLGCGLISWTVLDSHPHSHHVAIESLNFIDPLIGWAATAGGVLTTVDGGREWKEADLVEGTLSAIHVSFSADSRTGRIIGSSRRAGQPTPLVLTSGDKGSSWSEERLPIDGSPVSADACPDGTIHIATRAAVFSWSPIDLSWSESPKPASGEHVVTSVACTAAGGYLAAGPDGFLLMRYGPDGPVMALQAPHSAPWARVREIGGSIWIIGPGGLTLVSPDRGGFWEKREIPTNRVLFDIAAVGEELLIVGERGLILESRDQGRTWKMARSGTDADLATIFSLDEDHVWVGGSQGTVLGR